MKPELTTDELETLIERIIQTGKSGLRGTEIFEAYQLKAYIQNEINTMIEKGIVNNEKSDNGPQPDKADIEMMEKMIFEFYDEGFWDMYPEILYDQTNPSYKNNLEKLADAIVSNKAIHVLNEILRLINDFIQESKTSSPFIIGFNGEIHFNHEGTEEEKPGKVSIKRISEKIDALINEIDKKKQWESIFYEEQDYSKYKDLLIKFFTDESFKIPETTIITRPRTIAKVSILLKGLHEQFSDSRGHLKKDTRFHGIVRILHDWKNKNPDQIYKAIYKG